MVSLGFPRTARWPIRWRLPLLICGLLLVSVTAFAAIAYWDIQRASLETAHARLQNLAGQVATLRQVSAQQRLDEIRRLSARPPLRALLARQDDQTREAARADVEAFLKTNPQTLAVELWSRKGELLLSMAPTLTTVDPNRPKPPARTQPPTAEGFSPIMASNNQPYYDVIGAVPASPGQGADAGPIAGFVIQRRGLYSPGAPDIVRRLVGGTVAVRVGAPQDGIWTDFAGVVPTPPVTPDKEPPIDFVDDNGVRMLVATIPVTNTPWIVWVQMPRQEALAAGRVYLTRMIPLGLSVAAFGAVFAWVAARRITRPLDELTHAAESIATGDLSERVAVQGHDEIGRLGEAFNIMTNRVAASYQELDTRVRERTAELERALATLKNTQDELVRREKLAMLGQLASGVGHELRNPLAVMTNAVYFLEMIQRDAPPEVHEYHALLRAQIGLSEKIVSDLLDFARVKPPRREVVPLTHIVTEQLARFGAGEGVCVKCEIPPDLPPAHVDPIQIGQVVLNLLVNAGQAMEEQGGVLTLRASAEPGMLRLDVIDTGPGVPPELQEKIFEALFTTKARGIGLGLAVSRSLAEVNGGRLSVSSPPGEGATFTLRIPTPRPEATS